MSLVMVFSGGTALADEPFRPSDGNQVLEQVPETEGARIETLRAAVERQPDKPGPAVALAREYLVRYRQQGDARYLGYAEAAIEDWQSQENPPTDILLIRAHLRQSRHDFDGALQDLDQVVSRNPGRPQAWLTRASIATVLANYDLARESCRRLVLTAESLVVITCLAAIDSITQGPDMAYHSLEQALGSHGGSAPAIRAWALTLAGEIASRQGRMDVAEGHFQAAMELETPSLYLVNAYADLLLSEQRAQAALELLADRPESDGVLLRKALAADMLGSDEAAIFERRLRARFEAARARGDTVHRREAVRFLLELGDDPERALSLAQANWQTQREPTDARLLMRAALATNRYEAAEPALAWLGDRPVSVRLEALVEQLRRVSS